MPAHLRPITQPCAREGCANVATQELRNTHNGVVGVYCIRHAQQALEEFISWTDTGAKARGED